MNPRLRQATYPVGLVVFVLLLAVFKAVRLTSEMGGGWLRLVALLASDAAFPALIFLVALVQGLSRLKWLRGVCWLVLFLLTVVYLVDSFVLLALDQHATLFEIGRYVPEWGVVLSFIDASALTAILSLLVSVFVFAAPTPAMKRIGVILPAVALVAAVFGSVYAPLPLQRYAMLAAGRLPDIPDESQARAYTPEEISFYAALKTPAAAVPVSKPDIILLVVESLSSFNSEKLSGQPGLLERFDKLAEEGVLFRNFFANHQASEGGLIALLGGFPPMHFPTATPYMFDEFAIQDSVIAEYRRQGYYTDFLTSSDLAFIGLDRFLKGLGLDRSRGRDEVEAMRSAPRVVQDAPSDSWLYDEALSSVRQLRVSRQPFLLTLATTSTHLPYRHPEGGPDTPRAVWDWSLQQLAWFYARLAESGFFANGILLITADHRQMRPLSAAETERYGDSARARVPLLVIGQDYPRGRIDDRFFQQADLLRMLARINQPDLPLSPHPIWVERYNRKYGHIELIDNLGIFAEADQGRHEYRIRIPGNRTEWLGERPEFARQLEIRIHAQRSQHQHRRNSAAQPPTDIADEY